MLLRKRRGKGHVQIREKDLSANGDGGSPAHLSYAPIYWHLLHGPPGVFVSLNSIFWGYPGFCSPSPHPSPTHIPRTLANCQFLYAAVHGSGLLVVEVFLKCGKRLPYLFPPSVCGRTCHSLFSEGLALWAAWYRCLINFLNKWVATTNQSVNQSPIDQFFRKGPACHRCHLVNKCLRRDTKEKHGSRIEIHPNFTRMLKNVSHSCFL